MAPPLSLCWKGSKSFLRTLPEVSLKEARRRRDEARTLLRDGIDPGVERKRAKLTAELGAANTFGAVADEYIEEKLKKEGRAAVTVDKSKWLLLQLKPIFSQPIADIEPTEIFAVLRRLEGQGKHETAKRCRSFASRVFRCAVVTGRAKTDPAAMLRGALIAPKVKHHAAILDIQGACERRRGRFTHSAPNAFAQIDVARRV